MMPSTANFSYFSMKSSQNFTLSLYKFGCIFSSSLITKHCLSSLVAGFQTKSLPGGVGFLKKKENINNRLKVTKAEKFRRCFLLSICIK